jgi:hypothetical protein
VPVTEFRAPVIVGSGSLSFEMVRYLTERVDPGKMMRLRAEMKVPGRTWLEFQAVPEENEKNTA